MWWPDEVRTFRQDARLAVAAYVLLGAPLPVILWMLASATFAYQPTASLFEALALTLAIPFATLTVGVLVLYRLRSIDALTYACFTGYALTIAFIGGGLFVLVTGYTPNKYNPVAVPRSLCIPYFVVALIIALLSAIATAFNIRQRKLAPN